LDAVLSLSEKPKQGKKSDFLVKQKTWLCDQISGRLIGWFIFMDVHVKLE
jgi:hypothetical protein